MKLQYFATMLLLASAPLAAQLPTNFTRSATQEEVAPFEQALGACLGEPVEVAESTVMDTPGVLSLLFDWHETSEQRRARYTLGAQRGEISGQWITAGLVLNGLQVVGEEGRQVGFMGPVDTGEIREIVALLDAFLDELGLADRFRLELLQTSRADPLDCALLGLERPQGTPAEVLYQVRMTGPSTPVVMPESRARGGFISGGGATRWSFWLSRGANGLVLREVECEGNPESCGGELPASMHAAIPDPIDPAIREARLRAVLDAIPADYELIAIPMISRNLVVGRESLIALVSLRSADGATQSASVGCNKAIDDGSSWSCSFSEPRQVVRDPL